MKPTTTFFVRLTGMDPALVSRTTRGFQRQALWLGRYLLYCPLLTATAFSVALAHLGCPTQVSLLAGFLMFVVTFGVERSQVSLLGQPGLLVTLFRTALTAALLIVHTYTVDLLLFQTDVRQAAFERWTQKQQVRDDTYAAQLDVLDNRIDKQTTKQRHLNQELAKLDSIWQKVQGKLSWARTKELREAAAAAADNREDFRLITYAPTQHLLKQEIAQLQVEKNRIRLERDSVHALTFNYGRVGYLTRVRLLHQIVLQPDNWIMWPLMIGVLLVVLVIDLLPLFYRAHIDFAQYNILHLRDRHGRMFSSELSPAERLQMVAELERLLRELNKDLEKEC